MNVFRARWLSLALMALTVVCFLIALACSNVTTIVASAAGLVIFAASCVVQFVYHRCPHCGRFLDRNFWGEHCQYCGNLPTEERKQ